MASFRHKIVLLAMALLSAGCATPSEPTADATPASPVGMVHTAGMERDAMHGGAALSGATSPGQEAFGAIQEILALLEADPSTDWSRVDISALREHLVDMDDVTMRSSASMRDVPGGFEARVTGTGRTVGAIQRMATAHATMGLDAQPAWSAVVEDLPDGVVFTITSSDANEISHLRALGFYGVLATGGHHPAHHLAIARGENVHG